MTFSLCARVAAGACVALMVLSPARAADQAGVLWESTSQPEIEGAPMKMPAQTQKFCSAKEWKRPPSGGDKSCTTSNFKVEGSKATWTVECTGHMRMSGIGEMTFTGTDAYTGTVKFTGERMNMTVKLSGHKIGGCDNPQ